MAVITLECGGVIAGGKAQDIVNHIEASWARGQESVKLLRDRLPVNLVDTLAPLTNGGVHMHKTFGGNVNGTNQGTKITFVSRGRQMGCDGARV